MLHESSLDWTIVRPPQLTDKLFTGTYRVRENHLPYFGFTISRADVADFMIKTVEERSLIQDRRHQQLVGNEETCRSMQSF